MAFESREYLREGMMTTVDVDLDLVLDYLNEMMIERSTSLTCPLSTTRDVRPNLSSYPIYDAVKTCNHSSASI